MNICVQTSPGRRGEAKPRVFFVGARRLIVAGILDSWVELPYRYFEVCCEDGRRFLLRYDNDRRVWDLAGVFAPRVRAPRIPLLAPRRWWNLLLRAS
jgi:hypothetical protein